MKYLLIFLFSTCLFSSELFHQYYELTKNEQGERVIKAKDLHKKNSFAFYLKHISTFFDPEIKIRNIRKYDCKAVEYDNPKKVGRFFKYFSKTTRKFYFDNILKNRRLSRTVNAIEKRIYLYVRSEAYRTMSNIDQEGFFKENRFFEKVRGEVVKYALAQFDTTGAIKLINYIVSDYMNKVDRKRLFYQYHLYYFLKKYSASELGMTEEEHTKARASLAEAFYYRDFRFLGNDTPDIDWIHWGDYFDKTIADATNINQKYFEKHHGNITNKFSNIYSDTNLDEHEVVFNFFDTKKKAPEKAEIAYHSECPGYMYWKRYYQDLVRVNFELIPVPLPRVIFARYLNDNPRGTLKEGMLLAYFEEIQDKDKQEVVKKQSMIPFL